MRCSKRWVGFGGLVVVWVGWVAVFRFAFARVSCVVVGWCEACSMWLQLPHDTVHPRVRACVCCGPVFPQLHNFVNINAAEFIAKRERVVLIATLRAWADVAHRRRAIKAMSMRAPRLHARRLIHRWRAVTHRRSVCRFQACQAVKLYVGGCCLCWVVSQHRCGVLLCAWLVGVLFAG